MESATRETCVTVRWGSATSISHPHASHLLFSVVFFSVFFLLLVQLSNWFILTDFPHTHTHTHTVAHPHGRDVTLRPLPKIRFSSHFPKVVFRQWNTLFVRFQNVLLFASTGICIRCIIALTGKIIKLIQPPKWRCYSNSFFVWSSQTWECGSFRLDGRIPPPLLSVPNSALVEELDLIQQITRYFNSKTENVAIRRKHAPLSCRGEKTAIRPSFSSAVFATTKSFSDHSIPTKRLPAFFSTMLL